jgi:hypothetical protein
MVWEMSWDNPTGMCVSRFGGLIGDGGGLAGLSEVGIGLISRGDIYAD